MFLQRRTLFLAGGLAAVLVTALALGGQTVPPAAAPAVGAATAPVGRYQISAVSRNNAAQTAAYVIDTQTGEVFFVSDKQPPESIGSAAKPMQRK